MLVKIFHAVVSSILGTLLWICLHIGYHSTSTYAVPITILGDHAAHVLTPGLVEITLTGSWDLLRSFRESKPTVMIESTCLQKGLQEIPLTPQHLLLPPSLKLINYASIPVFVNPH